MNTFVYFCLLCHLTGDIVGFEGWIIEEGKDIYVKNWSFPTYCGIYTLVFHLKVRVMCDFFNLKLNYDENWIISL